MAEPAPVKKKKFKPVPINKLDSKAGKYDMKPLHDGYYKKWDKLDDPEECSVAKYWEIMSGMELKDIAAQSHEWHFLGTELPKITGISFTFYGLDEKGKPSYYASIYDANYPQNPVVKEKLKAVPFNPQTNQVDSFKGLMSQVWSSQQLVRTEEDLDGKLTQVQVNDNTVIWKIYQFDDLKTDAERDAKIEEFKKMKFDFACNQYSVKQCERKDKQVLIMAEGNNECMLIFKFQSGTLLFNWATTEYDSKENKRMKLGSLKGKAISVLNFVNTMVEDGMLGEKAEQFGA